MPDIQTQPRTAEALGELARQWGTTPGDALRRLVDAFAAGDITAAARDTTRSGYTYGLQAVLVAVLRARAADPEAAQRSVESRIRQVGVNAEVLPGVRMVRVSVLEHAGIFDTQPVPEGGFEYAFDVKLLAELRVPADGPRTALARVTAELDAVELNLRVTPGVRVTEISAEAPVTVIDPGGRLAELCGEAGCTGDIEDGDGRDGYCASSADRLAAVRGEA